MNEILDYLQRAPAPLVFDGHQILNFRSLRHSWLAEIFAGSIDEKINRRAKLTLFPPPFYAPWRGVRASIRRHRRMEFRKAGLRWEYRHLSNATD